MYCIDLALDMDRWRTLVNAVMKFQVAENARNFLNSSETVSFLRRTPAPWNEQNSL